MSKKRVAFWWVVWVVFLVVVDQVTKYWQSVEGLVSLNSGVAFSLGTSFRYWWVLIALVLVLASSYVAREFSEWVRERNWFYVVGSGLLLAGGWANLADRIRYAGQVRDWIRVWVWPSFNLADTWVTLGVVVVIIGLWWSEARGKSKDIIRG